MWLVATVFKSAVKAARRLLNQFSGEYCIELKHGWKTVKDTLTSHILGHK